MSFPKDFLWGVACASYQCEGAWNEDGKGPNIWDDFCHEPGHVLHGDTGDVACDTYHRYKEDVALMKAHNIKAYRFSISWARVIPDGDGVVNEKGLQFYDNLVNELLENGIEPMITLYHWDLPSALQDKGGWLNREIVKAFGRFALIIAKRFKGRVKKYMTINEPQCVAVSGYYSGIHAPGLKLGQLSIAKIYHHLCLAHSAAMRAVKAVDPDALVGASPCGRLAYPLNDTPEGRQASYRASFDLSEDWLFTFNIFLDSLIFKRYDDSVPAVVKQFAATVDPDDWDMMEKPDFIGVNVYQGYPVDDTGAPVPFGPGHPRTAINWPVTPEVLSHGPRNLYQRYGLPMYITENGLSCNDKLFLDGQVHDPDRIDFLNRYLRELEKTIGEGTPVLGYLQWSFLDNFEWAQGYNERFGLVYVDYGTCQRTPKDSARWYARVIETNGEIL